MLAPRPDKQRWIGKEAVNKSTAYPRMRPVFFAAAGLLLYLWPFRQAKSIPSDAPDHQTAVG